MALLLSEVHSLLIGSPPKSHETKQRKSSEKDTLVRSKNKTLKKKHSENKYSSYFNDF